MDKESLVVSSIDDVHVACEGVRNLTTVPLIVTSNVTGAGCVNCLDPFGSRRCDSAVVQHRHSAKILVPSSHES